MDLDVAFEGDLDAVLGLGLLVFLLAPVDDLREAGGLALDRAVRHLDDPPDVPAVGLVFAPDLALHVPFERVEPLSADGLLVDHLHDAGDEGLALLADGVALDEGDDVGGAPLDLAGRRVVGNV